MQLQPTILTSLIAQKSRTNKLTATRVASSVKEEKELARPADYLCRGAPLSSERKLGMLVPFAEFPIFYLTS